MKQKKKWAQFENDAVDAVSAIFWRVFLMMRSGEKEEDKKEGETDSRLIKIAVLWIWLLNI